MEKTFYKVSKRYYWKGMTNDIMDYIRKCDECQKSNMKTKIMPVEMQPVEIPKSTWKNIDIDLIGPFKDAQGQPMSGNGYRYVFTVIDYFSSYLEAFPLKRKLAKEVAEKLFKLFCRQGVSLELVSDNGGDFNSSLTKATEEKYGYKHILITSYHHQFNGKCERVNQSIKSMLNKTIQENESTSELVLPKCVFAYNSSKQSTTRYSPFYLMYWRNPVLPNENAFGETANTLAKYVEISSNEIEKTVENLTNSQKKITPDVLDNVNSA
jgi:transposase InsO family protein